MPLDCNCCFNFYCKFFNMLIRVAMLLNIIIQVLINFLFWIFNGHIIKTYIWKNNWIFGFMFISFYFFYCAFFPNFYQIFHFNWLRAFFYFLFKLSTDRWHSRAYISFEVLALIPICLLSFTTDIFHSLIADFFFLMLFDQIL